MVVAGGSGRRFGALKQFADLATGERVIDRSVRVALQVSTGVVVVLPADDLDAVGAGEIDGVPVHVVAGGSTRAESVGAGLAAVPAEATVICVHDGARPFADGDLYERVLAALDDPDVDGVVPGVAVTDTIKLVASNSATSAASTPRAVASTPAREDLVAVQTPQAFRAAVLRRAHELLAGEESLTDDAMMLEHLGHRVVVVEGSATNRKITRPEDLDWARAMAAHGEAPTGEGAAHERGRVVS